MHRAPDVKTGGSDRTTKIGLAQALQMISFAGAGSIFAFQLFGGIGPPIFFSGVGLLLYALRLLDWRRVRKFRRLSEATSTSVFWTPEPTGSGTLTVDERGLFLKRRRSSETAEWKRAVEISIHPKGPVALGSLCTLNVRLDNGQEVRFDFSDGDRMIDAARRHAPSQVRIHP